MKSTKFLFPLILLLSFFTSVARAQSLSEVINSKDAVLVDVRSEKEFDEGSVKGAINIPVDIIDKQAYQLKGKKVVVFCRSGKRAEKAYQILKKQGVNVYNGKTVDNVKMLQKSNIIQKVKFLKDKPSVFVIKSGSTAKQVAVALGKDAVLPNHTTSEPALLVVLRGKVKFIIAGEEILLNTYDTYHIPADIEHELVGLDKENLFTVTKSKDW